MTAESRLPGVASNRSEMNDHPVATATRQNSVIAINIMKGAFGNEAPFHLLRGKLPFWELHEAIHRHRNVEIKYLEVTPPES
jgi:hypothetical protein